MASPTPEAAEPAVVFRPGKKRKAYRQRSEDSEAPTPEPSNEKSTVTSGKGDDGSLEARDTPQLDLTEEGLSVAEVIRRRNARKARLGGVAFRAEPASKSAAQDAAVAHELSTDQSLVAHEGGGGAVDTSTGGIVKRFASQTGLVGELVNKHMEDYIESELARRQRHATEHAAAQSQSNDKDFQLGGASGSADTAAAPMQPALRGKLLEIDLGDEVRARNVVMTEQARRRLEGQGAEDEDGPSDGPPKKVRLGKDGKPWRPRNRRNSDDVKRDQLVEEFLRENRLDVYDVPTEQGPSSMTAGEEADDRIAEEFRREFMEAMSARRQRRKPAINAPPSKAPKAARSEDILRGPKLGGSRNVRAAMRDLLLKEQQERR